MPLSLLHSAVLVIDMQLHFEDIAGHLVPRLIPLIDAYHSKGLPVYFTQHGHLPDDKGTLVRRWGPPGKGSHVQRVLSLELPTDLINHGPQDLSCASQMSGSS